jgi:hypothetical protein
MRWWYNRAKSATKEQNLTLAMPQSNLVGWEMEAIDRPGIPAAIQLGRETVPCGGHLALQGHLRVLSAP